MPDSGVRLSSMRIPDLAITVTRWPLLRELIRRELTSRYLGTFSGGLWALAQPLLQLAIYGYVFTYVFRARLPAEEFGSVGFLSFLAIGLWPWNAFAESLNRSTTVIPDSAGLLGKIALPRAMLVAAPVLAGFVLHAAGFALVLTVLWVGGWLPLHSTALLAPLLLLCLMFFTLGLAWFFAAVAVFVRDIAQALPQLLLLLFFLTPVLYPRSLVPERLQVLSDFNPLALFIGLFRQCLLGIGTYGVAHVLTLAALTAFVLWAGYRAFQRLSPHFEDFL